YLEKHGTRARRAAFLDPRFHQRAADAAATSRLVHRDVEQVHLVRDAPAAAVPDEHRTRVRLLDGYGELRERRGQLLLEKGARPGLREGAPLDLEHRRPDGRAPPAPEE